MSGGEIIKEVSPGGNVFQSLDDDPEAAKVATLVTVNKSQTEVAAGVGSRYIVTVGVCLAAWGWRIRCVR